MPVVEKPGVVAHQRLQFDLVASPARWMQAQKVQLLLLDRQRYAPYPIVSVSHKEERVIIHDRLLCGPG
jgi:hypothetical protein